MYPSRPIASRALLLSFSSFVRPFSSSPASSDKVDVVVIGCGLPKKSMGWYHLEQLLTMPSVKVKAVVEPFYLSVNPADVPQTFASMVNSLKNDITFTSSVSELANFTEKTIVLIAGRTSDNPKLFQQALEKGAGCIYLEKPGAPSFEELQRMKALALLTTPPTRIFVGYNKNVTNYVKEALKLSESINNSQVEFIHNNSYTRDGLDECFERNSEGMLKNMAIHELAVLVSFFGVKVSNISKLIVDKENSEKLTLNGRTDFSKVRFTITTKDNKSVTVTADRCGGEVAHAIVRDKSGKVVGTFDCPNSEEVKEVEEQVKADPEMMGYFFSNSKDYLQLKTEVVDMYLGGGSEGTVATIDVAIEALKLAEWVTSELEVQL